MQDRVPLYPGRVKLVPVPGQENTYDMTRADQPTQEGTPLNKASLWADDTASLFGLDANSVPNDGFKKLYEQNQATKNGLQMELLQKVPNVENSKKNLSFGVDYSSLNLSLYRGIHILFDGYYNSKLNPLSVSVPGEDTAVFTWSFSDGGVLNDVSMLMNSGGSQYGNTYEKVQSVDFYMCFGSNKHFGAIKNIYSGGIKDRSGDFQTFHVNSPKLLINKTLVFSGNLSISPFKGQFKNIEIWGERYL